MPAINASDRCGANRLAATDEFTVASGCQLTACRCHAGVMRPPTPAQDVRRLTVHGAQGRPPAHGAQRRRGHTGHRNDGLGVGQTSIWTHR